jgi:hypothetical protein
MIKEHILSQLVRDNLLHDKIFLKLKSAGYDKPIFKSLEKNKRQVTRSRCIKIIKTHLKLR